MADQIIARITDEDLLALGKHVKTWVRDGELIILSPNKAEHGAHNAKVVNFLATFVVVRDLGRIFTEMTTFNLEVDSEGGIKDSVAPDIAFVSYERLPRDASLDLIPRVAPELVVENMSPSESLSDTLEKAQYYLEHGVLFVWLLNARRREVRAFSHSDRKGTVLSIKDEVKGEGILEGFAVPVRAIFGEDNELQVKVLRKLMVTGKS